MTLAWRDVDLALDRLAQVLRPRVGKRMTALCLQNLAAMREHAGATPASALAAAHATLDAYARIDESGAPFPLEVCRVIGARGCPKLFQVNTPARLDMVPLVANHADALLPTYGEDDADFAVRVAWKNAHQYLLHLVVGRAFNRNESAPTRTLFDAWQAQGAPLVDDRAPIGVVEGAGVIYAALRRDVDVLFVPHAGDPLVLSHADGLQRFFARVPLSITPDTLAWILHLVRFALGADVVVAGALSVDWEPKEGAPGLGAGSVLLGLTPPPVEERASIELLAHHGGPVVARYAPGELSVAGAGAGAGVDVDAGAGGDVQIRPKIRIDDAQ